ncbi:hypothetical protein AX14_010361 [Amanita brunnescens Koide BX004]|nr:hypothetical protein AX14_010361 [Amanita brunnescens Koide BX004]
MTVKVEPAAALAFKHWLSKHGGGFHKDVMIVEDIWGVSILAKENLPPNALVVSCPFSLIISQSLARRALSSFINVHAVDNWTERQWISTYLCFHWIITQNTGEGNQNLFHYEYIHLLPSPDKLRTPHYFTASELEAFRGTNLYGATLDQRREWRAEYAECLAAISRANAEWAALFTWSLCFLRVCNTFVIPR